MIEGIPRYGTTNAMTTLGISGEAATIAGAARILNLARQTEDPDVAGIVADLLRQDRVGVLWVRAPC
jgi:hypothetical protein